MFERFTERSRQAVQFAHDTAREQGASKITTGHLLVGLFREEGGIAARVLAARELPDGAKLSVERLVEKLPLSSSEVAPKIDEAQHARDQIPFTEQCKRALELALREALSLGHNYIGTEHLLLGLNRLGDVSDGGRMLVAVGFGPGEATHDVSRLLSRPERQPERKPDTYTAMGLFCRNCGWQDARSLGDKLQIPKGTRIESMSCPNCDVVGTLTRKDR